MSGKLIFEASAYRDWTVLYCQLAHDMWISEFKKQFGWGLSDLCFEWDGHTTIVYRVIEEHLDGLARLVKIKMEKDSNFLLKVADSVYKESKNVEKYLKSLESIDLETISWNDFKKHLDSFISTIVSPTPKIFIVIYFPQAIENSPEDMRKYKKDIKALIQARDSVHHIVGPIGNEWCNVFCETVIKRVGLDYNLSRFVSLEEIEYVFKTKGRPESVWLKKFNKNLHSRQKYFITGGRKVWTITLKEYIEFLGWELKEFDLNVGEIKGSVVYSVSKKISGVVKLVRSKNEFKKVKDGDIIVAPMTTPEYLPIIKRARAIITNEGGITCHAAVIAREFKIPVVIGTKIATQVLKDGDLVEVDADKGVVRIVGS